MTTQTLTEQVPGSPVAVSEEAAAAELEGLVPITAEQLTDARRYKVLRDRVARDEAEMNEIKTRLKTQLAEAAHTGLMYRGRKVVSRKLVRKPFINQTRLRAENPRIAARYTEIREEIHLVVTT